MGAGIRDVARLAQVSPSTVSRVLNDKAGSVPVSAATIERVRSAAAQLKYQPNAAARSLRTTRAHTIGVISRNLLHPFSAELLRVMYDACRPRGYHLLVGHSEHSNRAGWEKSDIFSADRVDGVLVIGDYLLGTTREEDMARLVQMHGHVVAVGGRPSMAGELAILVDDTRGVTLALEHLVALGHRSIGYIRQRHPAVSWESWEDQQRRAAYRNFLTASGLPYTPDAELIASNQIEEIQEALRRLLALPQRPTAVFVNNDLTAIVTIKAALTCGIRVPEDLSIVGFDDIPFAALCTPGLTTIRQPVDAMGRHAATVLLDRVTGVEMAPPSAEVAGSATLFFSPSLVCRESASRHLHTSPGGETIHVA